MKFYVSGKWEERGKVHDFIKKLEEKGHTVTVDWTGQSPEDPEYPRGYSCKDIQGIVDCDAFIGVYINPYNYRGAMVELGAALALGKQVALIGHAIDSCMFVHHPLVTRFSNEQDFFRRLRLS